uniref:Ig-like domain-containing protein n=1 Tax=Vombatus ursinus TaxID=29139 RepID=A0A4X2LA70_VOMUR
MCAESPDSFSPCLYFPLSQAIYGSACVSVSDPKVAPTLFPLNSRDSDSIIIGCLAQSFFPEPVNMAWVNGSEGTVRNYPAAQIGNTYTQATVLDFPAGQCTDTKSYQCQVDHYGIIADLIIPCKGKRKKFKPSNPPIYPSCPTPAPSPNCKTPQVSLSPPSLESLLLGTGANLTCTLSGLKDGNGVKFTWEHTPAQSSTSKPIQGTPEKDSSGKYSVSSVLEICAEDWTRGDNFSCTVSHCEIENTTKTISKLEVYLLPPSADELALNELVSITCLVRGHSPPEALVYWLKGSERVPREDYIISGPYPEPKGNNTFIISSILQVSASEWKAENKYSCVVGHEALPLNFTQQTIDRFSGKPTNVNVSVILSDVYGTCY